MCKKIIFFCIFIFCFNINCNQNKNNSFFNKMKNIVLKIKKYCIKNKKIIRIHVFILSASIILYCKIARVKVDKVKKNQAPASEINFNIDRKDEYNKINVFNFHSLIEANDKQSIAIRQKIARAFGIKALPGLMKVLNKLDYSFKPWEEKFFLSEVNALNSIGLLFEKGLLEENDKKKIMDTFYKFPVELQDVLRNAVFDVIKNDI